MFFVPITCCLQRRREKGFFGDTPNPGKGRCPLHSCFAGACTSERKGICGASHALAKDAVLCTLVAIVPVATQGKDFWLSPHRGKGVQRTLSLSLCLRDAVPCIFRIYDFLNVQVTLPKESLSPSLTGVALSGSRRLPLMRVELVLFRSVTV